MKKILGPEEPCDVIAGQTLQREFWDNVPKGQRTSLLERGFSQAAYGLVQSDYCVSCDICAPSRIRLADFEPSKSLRDALRRNEDIVMSVEGKPVLDDHAALLTSYMNERQNRGNFSQIRNTSFYRSVLRQNFSRFSVVDFRSPNGALVAAAHYSEMPDAAVGEKHYYDVRQSARSLGIFAILKLTLHLQEKGLSYFYLGGISSKPSRLSYKQRFKALETMNRQGQWADFTPGI